MSKIKLEDLKYVGSEKKEEIVEEVTATLSDEIVQPEVESKEIEDVSKENDPADTVTYTMEESIIGTIVKVVKLPIYATPSMNTPARLFTGNVQIIGKLDQFYIVKYVRAGFGSVKGYTTGLHID